MATFDLQIASMMSYKRCNRNKSKSKGVLLLAMKAVRGEEVQLLLILDLGTRLGEWSASRPGRALPQGKEPPVPIG
jgi:hypothetical protein